MEKSRVNQPTAHMVEMEISLESQFGANASACGKNGIVRKGESNHNISKRPLFCISAATQFPVFVDSRKNHKQSEK